MRMNAGVPVIRARDAVLRPWRELVLVIVGCGLRVVVMLIVLVLHPSTKAFTFARRESAAFTTKRASMLRRRWQRAAEFAACTLAPATVGARLAPRFAFDDGHVFGLVRFARATKLWKGRRCWWLRMRYAGRRRRYGDGEGGGRRRQRRKR